MTDATDNGVALVERVIAEVQAKGFAVLGETHRPASAPQPVPPEALASLSFPDGSPLSPSLRRWLAFDAAWLGWFEDVNRPVFRPKKLGQFTRDAYEVDWGFDAEERIVAGDCFGVPFGDCSVRFLYVGVPDSLGEHPVLLADTDDQPFLCVEYPGIDVYLGIHAGLIPQGERVYGALASDRRYSARMKEHAKNNLGGKASFEVGSFAEQAPPPWKPGEPAPAGWRVGINPFTKQPLLVPASFPDLAERNQQKGGKATVDEEAPPPWKPGEPAPAGWRVGINPFTKTSVLVRSR